MVKCEVCGKELKDARGLNGHRWLTHGIKPISREEALAKEVEELKAKLEQHTAKSKAISLQDLRIFLYVKGWKLTKDELRLIGEAIRAQGIRATA